jgi:hypothetical protein
LITPTPASNSATPASRVAETGRCGGRITLNRAQQTALLRIERAFREAKLPPHAWYDVLWELDRAGESGLRPFELEGRMLIAQSTISETAARRQHRQQQQRGNAPRQCGIERRIAPPIRAGGTPSPME